MNEFKEIIDYNRIEENKKINDKKIKLGTERRRRYHKC